MRGNTVGAELKTTRREALIAAGAMAAGTALFPAHVSAADTKVEGQIPADVVALSDFERLAHQRIEHTAWEYIESGAADEITLRWNREAFERIKLNPHVLHDVGHLDTSVVVLGQKLAYPVMLAPSALHKLAHPEGEVATARGAGKADASMVLSTMASYS